MSPMVDWVAQKSGHSFGKLFKPFVVGNVWVCAKLFGYSVAAHCAPFVVVAVKPNLGYVVPRLVFGNLFWFQMTVIVYNRQAFGVFVIQLLSRLGF